MTSVTSSTNNSFSEPASGASSDDEADDPRVQSLANLDPASQAIPTSSKARAKRRIAALEDELATMRQERGGKQRKTTFYVAQGRAIRRLSCSLPHHGKLDRRERSQKLSSTRRWKQPRSKIAHSVAMLNCRGCYQWLHDKLGELDQEDSECYVEEGLKKGADAACGDDTSSLKELVAVWVNQEFRPSPLIKPNDKYLRGFTNDICGKLLCPAEWDWDKTSVKTGIRDRTSEYIVSENSWPLFVYEKYQYNSDDIEEGFLKSKLLVLAFKAVFTSPSSAREADGDGDGADILENNRRAHRKSELTKVKTCVASIINMKKVTPRAIAVRFALSSVSSWRTVDGDFDYEVFWNNIVDYFEVLPGPVAKLQGKYLEQIISEDLTPEVVSHMSVNALAEQRKRLEDAVFDSD
ncbi:hypothetical protein DEU56DRAFT_907878 [Suillus clintonianus]|uniref:uncharacterized protein n=1 Tax=Suillus clintonianus TaxID=1904413 RepID=UPI001B87476D|nr:uncharacterized protein DEU56DRAFT_907878 [Suillus clintonianus]KAG2152704.1 hypothetical protein DEU56DRAFT_907878 [Suillus clintonianus]